MAHNPRSLLLSFPLGHNTNSHDEWSHARIQLGAEPHKPSVEHTHPILHYNAIYDGTQTHVSQIPTLGKKIFVSKNHIFYIKWLDIREAKI
jgi:hypothetical protein